MKSSKSTVEEVFFNAASNAALESFVEKGKISVCMTALIETKEDSEIFPVIVDTSSMDIRLIEDQVSKAVEPLAQYVLKNKGSSVRALFMSALGEGTVKDQATEEITTASMIINGARTNEGIGKTEVFQIRGDSNFDVLDPGYKEDETWRREPADFDLPGIAIQTILTKAWITYVSTKNVMELGL